VIDQDVHKKKSKFLIKRVVLWTALLLFSLAAVAVVWFTVYVFEKGPILPEEKVVVIIPKGTSVRAIGKILGDAALIHNDVRFSLLTQLSGFSGRLQAGEFRLSSGQRPADVIKELVFAKPVQHAVTIIEGLRAIDIAAVFEREGWCDGKRFLDLIGDKEFLRRLGFSESKTLEGYLYPDTYLLTREMKGAEKIITMMVKRFSEVWAGITSEIDHKVDRKAVVILASIVEKETGAASERALISGVFSNRLARGMRLQSDPTVIYGVENFSGKITKKQLRNPTPYNTYTLFGLPAGPICNPGGQALLAALFPAKTKYLYFVSKNDGTHHFSKSLSAHNRAVRKFQKKKKNKAGK